MRNFKKPVKKRIDYVDLLRILAISVVISFHFLYSAIVNEKTPQLSPSPFFSFARYGYLGVELFFMITGFVLYQSIEGMSFGKFVKNRFVRLYPMYWLAIILIYLVSSLGIWDKPGPSATDFFYNLTMSPTSFGHDWLDAAHWFMGRQLEFYVAVMVILLLRVGKFISQIFSCWSIVGFTWNLFNFNDFHIWYFNGYFALIVGGALINAIRLQGFSLLRVVALISSYLWAISTRIDKIDWLNSSRSPGHSAITIGILVTLIYLLLALTWSSRISNAKIAGASFAGALSYPIFLVHDRLGGLVLARFGTEGNRYAVYLLVIAGAVATAYSIWKLESRLMNFFAKPVRISEMKK